jgi:hypothetical protein
MSDKVSHEKVKRLCEDCEYFLIKPQAFEEVAEFREGMAAVKLNDKWGFVDRRGNMAIPAIYKDTKGFCHGVACVLLDGRVRVINTQGETVTETDYTYISASDYEGTHWPDSTAGFTVLWDAHPDKALVNPNKSFVNHWERRVVALPECYGVSDFGEGFAGIYDDDDIYGFINMDGEIVIPIQFDSVCYFDGGYAEVCKDGKWGLIDTSGRVVIPLEYERIIHQGGTVAFEQNELLGFMDLSGNILTPPCYDRVYIHSANEIMVTKDGAMGIVTADGKELIPIKYHLDIPGDNNLWKAGIDGKYGFIDTTGKVAVPFIYDNVDCFHYGRAEAELNGKAGMIDESGKAVIPFEYDCILDTWHGLTVANKNNILYLLDENGDSLLPDLPFRGSRPFSEDGLAWIGIDGLWGAVGMPEEGLG